MTRKDFILLSRAIYETNKSIRGEVNSSNPVERVFTEKRLEGVRQAASTICNALVDECGRAFDPAMFLKNCGFGTIEISAHVPPVTGGDRG